MFGTDEDRPEDKFTRFRRTTSEVRPDAWPKLIAVVAIVAAITVGAAVLQNSDQDSGFAVEDTSSLVLYCAHDLPFVEPLIEEFETETGITVALVADTEASKSLGLTRRIYAERRKPQADVFWNNQLLGTIELAGQGVFESHADVAERDRFESQNKDDDGLWTAFAARLRVWIINDKDKASPWPKDRILNQLPDDPNFCVADPLFGTTLTHAAVLWKQQGRDSFVAWYESLPRKGVRIVPGNSATRDLVSDGVCQDGWTDTDDFFGAVDRGAAVRMDPVLTADAKTIAIPNSVAVIKNCPHPTAARKFVSWLLSETTERKLASGRASQVPLGSLVQSDPLPARVQSLLPSMANAVDLQEYVDARKEALEFLSGRDR